MENAPSLRNVKSQNAVLEALHQVNHATASEILDWLKVTQKNMKVSLTSVYRALNHLVATSQVKPLNFNDGQVRYELNTHAMHHHHMICTKCNLIQVLDLCPFDDIADKVKDTFSIQYHNFELFGLCGNCK